MDGHKGSVNSVAVHPNGTVALSVGRCATAEGMERCKLIGSCCLRACEGEHRHASHWTAYVQAFTHRVCSVLLDLRDQHD